MSKIQGDITSAGNKGLFLQTEGQTVQGMMLQDNEIWALNIENLQILKKEMK